MKDNDNMSLEKAMFILRHGSAEGLHKMAEHFTDYLISKGATIPVRCEECKHFDSIDENLPYNVGLCNRDNSYWFPLDFCSYGERKEDER